MPGAACRKRRGFLMFESRSRSVVFNQSCGLVACCRFWARRQILKTKAPCIGLPWPHVAREVVEMFLESSIEHPDTPPRQTEAVTAIGT